MKTISTREFTANLDVYFDLARQQDVRIRKGRLVFHLICEPDDTDNITDEKEEEAIARYLDAVFPDGLPPMGTDEEEIANAITGEELLKGIHEDIRRKWAERQK